MHDKVNIVQSVGVETMSRRMYALERVFEECHKPGDWRPDDKKSGHKTKAQWRLLRTIDLVADGRTRVSVADAATRKQLETDALDAKWISKTGASEGGAGE